MAIGRNIRQFLADMISPSDVARVENKFNEAFLWNIGGGYTNYPDEAVTYIDKGYNINPIVYSVINQQSTKTASIPFEVRKVKDEDAKRRLDAFDLATKWNLTASQYLKRLQLEVKAFDGDYLPFPMERPNATQTWTEFKALYKTFLKLTGNVYIYMLAPLEGQNAGEPIQVYLLPSHLVQIILRPKADLLGVESPVSGYILTQGRQFIEFDAKNVIHIKYSNPNYDSSGSHLYGQSPLRAGLKNIQDSNLGLDLNIKTLKSGGAFGFIHAKQTALTEAQAAEIKSRLLEMHASPEDLSKIAGVSAEIGFTRLSLTSEELKPFDYLRFDQKQICNVLNWSDKLLNSDEGAKYDNVNQFRKQVVTDNIVPDLDLLVDALNREFLPRFKGYEGAYISYDVMELPEMQSDISERSKWLDSAVDRGVINRNEYRRSINFPVLDDDNMEQMTVQSGVVSLEETLDTNFMIE